MLRRLSAADRLSGRLSGTLALYFLRCSALASSCDEVELLVLYIAEGNRGKVSLYC